MHLLLWSLSPVFFNWPRRCTAATETLPSGPRTRQGRTEARIGRARRCRRSASFRRDAATPTRIFRPTSGAFPDPELRPSGWWSLGRPGRKRGLLRQTSSSRMTTYRFISWKTYFFQWRTLSKAVIRDIGHVAWTRHAQIKICRSMLEMHSLHDWAFVFKERYLTWIE